MTIELLSELPVPDRYGRACVNPAYEELAEVCRANPGQWAKCPDTVSRDAQRSTARRIRVGEGPAPLRAGFEAAIRNTFLYVRFVGEGGEQ